MARFYIAGPMTGYEGNNAPAFDAAVRFLREEGHASISPPELDKLFGYDASNVDKTIRIDLESVMQADGIFMLRGWEKSVCARAEHAVAVWRGIEIRYQQG